MNPYDLAVLAIATWYISYILTAQQGPFSILLWLRQHSGGLLQCIYCTAPYVAGVLYLLARHLPEAQPLIDILAIAGSALMLRSYTGAGLGL